MSGGIQMNLGPTPTSTAITDDQVRELFSVSEGFLVAILGTKDHPLVRLRKRPHNDPNATVDPSLPLAITRNNFGTPIEVRNR